MDVHPVLRQPPGLARQFRWQLIGITNLLLLTLLVRVCVNIYTTAAQNALLTHVITLSNDMNQMLSSMENQKADLREYSATANPVSLEQFNQGRSQYLSAHADMNHLLHYDRFSQTLTPFSEMHAHAEAWYLGFALLHFQPIRIGHFPPQAERTEEAFDQGNLLFAQFRTSLWVLQQRINDAILLLQDRQQIINWSALLAATGISLAALALLWFTFRVFLRDLTSQLTTVKHVAQQFSDGNHQVRVDSLKYDELEIIGQTLNQLIETVELQQTILQEQVHEVEQVNGEFRALFNAVPIAILFLSPTGRILTPLLSRQKQSD